MAANGADPTVRPIDGTDRGCDWAMVDKYGELYPHGITARRRVVGAGEMLDGDYCIRHAKEAVRWWRERIEPSV